MNVGKRLRFGEEDEFGQSIYFEFEGGTEQGHTESRNAALCPVCVVVFKRRIPSRIDTAKRQSRPVRGKYRSGAYGSETVGRRF